MGPNGAGKSTLSNVLTGRDGYSVSGTVTLDGVDLLGLSPEDRAAAGVFLAFQYPIEIPGVGNMYFLRTSVNALRRRSRPRRDRGHRLPCPGQGAHGPAGHGPGVPQSIGQRRLLRG